MKFSDRVALRSFNLLFYGLLIFSILAVISIHINLNKYQFYFSPKGLNIYLESYKEFSTLFITTITVIIAKFTLMQWHASVETTKDKIKEDRFKEWCFVLERRLNEKEKEGNDKVIVENFYTLRGELFKTLYEMNMSVKNILELYDVLKIFQLHIKNFEHSNSKNSGVYFSPTYSYSFGTFSYILLNCFDFRYSNIDNDLSTWYLEQMNKNRKIDLNA